LVSFSLSFTACQAISSSHLARATLQGLQIRKGASELLASLTLGNTESRARLVIDRLDIADRASLSVENANASL